MQRDTASRHPLPAAITRTVIISCHIYGPAKFVAAETRYITKDVDAAIVRIRVHGSLDGPMTFFSNLLHWQDAGDRIRGRGKD